jgi:hypothetical protein
MMAIFLMEEIEKGGGGSQEAYFLSTGVDEWDSFTSINLKSFLTPSDSYRHMRRTYPVQPLLSATTRVAKKNMLTGNLKCMFVFSSFSFLGISFEPLKRPRDGK